MERIIAVERVIFRTEHDPYTSMEKYLAIFPDDRTAPGMIACVPFWFDGHGAAIFEPYTEMDYGYYVKSTKIIHKKDERVQKLLQAVTDYYSHEVPAKFRVVEKIMH